MTGSREGTVVVWGQESDKKYVDKSILELKKSVTALAFGPGGPPYLMAIGTEDGDIYLYTWTPQEEKKEGWNLSAHLQKRYYYLSTNNKCIVKNIYVYIGPMYNIVKG